MDGAYLQSQSKTTQFNATMSPSPEPRDWSKYGVVAGLLIALSPVSQWVGVGMAATSALYWTTRQIVDHSVYMGWTRSIGMRGTSNRLERRSRSISKAG